MPSRQRVQITLAVTADNALGTRIPRGRLQLVTATSRRQLRSSNTNNVACFHSKNTPTSLIGRRSFIAAISRVRNSLAVHFRQAGFIVTRLYNNTALMLTYGFREYSMETSERSL